MKRFCNNIDRFLQNKDLQYKTFTISNRSVSELLPILEDYRHLYQISYRIDDRTEKFRIFIRKHDDDEGPLFLSHIEWDTKTIQGWPQWKKDVIGIS